MSYTLFMGSGGQQTANADFRRLFDFCDVCFMPRGGIVDPYYPDRLHQLHQVCAITEVSNISSSAQNEADVIEAGKTRITENEGYLHEFTINMKADEVLGLMAMAGMIAGNQITGSVDMLAAIERGKDFGAVGDLFFYSSGKDRYAMASMVITEVEIQLIDTPGVTDGGSDQTVNFRSKGKIFHSGRGAMFVPFMFFDNGTVINPNAPDGTLTDFDLRTANNAFDPGPAAPLLAQTIDPNESSLFRHILAPRLNGALISPSAASFDQPTGVLSMNSAPAAGAKLSGIVLVPSGFPPFDPSRRYAPGMVVEDAGVYYVCNTATTIGAAFDATEWDALTDQTFPVPLFKTDGLPYPNTETWYYPLHSWTEIGAQ